MPIKIDGRLRRGILLRETRNYRQDAKTIALQMQKNGVRKYMNGFPVTMHEYALNMPRLLREPSFIFVCSMPDLFHEDVPFELIDKMMDVIRSTQDTRIKFLRNEQNVWQNISQQGRYLQMYGWVLRSRSRV